MNIQEQIEKSEEEFDELGAIFSFPHTAVNAKAEIPQRDGFPMIYNGMYITHDILHNPKYLPFYFPLLPFSLSLSDFPIPAS